jgi:hypothetical protein
VSKLIAKNPGKCRVLGKVGLMGDGVENNPEGIFAGTEQEDQFTWLLIENREEEVKDFIDNNSASGCTDHNHRDN